MGNSVMIDLNDERAGKLAGVLGSVSAKKILNLLAEREMSGSELASELKMPLNTIGYNIDKLMDAGLIEETKGFLWSVKGKRIMKYRVSNKRIVISPKALSKGVIPAVLVTALVSLGIKMFYDNRVVQTLADSGKSEVVQSGGGVASSAATSVGMEAAKVAVPAVSSANGAIISVAQSNVWAWFFLGALMALLVVLVWNWKRK